MNLDSKHQNQQQHVLKLNGVWVAYAHTFCALAAFLSALIVGVTLHYHKIVQNGYYGYPDEWFPSVSATIGDRYPERSIFQIMIALTAGPRFLLLFLSYLRLNKTGSYLPLIGLVSGILRTFTCGGWVYITSTDDHDAHDIFMISYIVLTIPWTVCVTKLTDKSNKLLKNGRRFTAVAFFGLLVPLVYLFIQHKVHRVAGAYSYYAYVEWSLIFLDIGFDTWSVVDFKDLEFELSAAENAPPTVLNLSYFSQDETSSTDEKEAVREKLVPGQFPVDTLVGLTFIHSIVQIINSFIFWSVFTALFLCIWHFPLWNMGISGYEAAALSLMAPVLLVVPPLRNLFARFPQIPRLLTALFGVGSYKFEAPADRLLILSVGTCFGFISLSNEIWTLGQIRDSLALSWYSTTFTLGLITSSIAKFAFYTNNPIWPIMHTDNGGLNIYGVIIGVVSALSTPSYLTQLNPTEISSGVSKGYLFPAAVGVGGLIFSLDAMLTDTSTLILWCWEGYPVRGPLPVPHGVFTFVAMAIGTYLGFTKPSLVSSSSFFIAGSAGAAVLYASSGWIGYIGGLVYSIFLTGIIPVIFTSASQFNVGLVFGLGFFLAILISLAHVWVVAYAFVPAGWILRERTDIVLGISVAMVGLGIVVGKKANLIVRAKNHGVGTSLRKRLTKIAGVLLVLSAVISFRRLNFEKPQPYHPEDKLLTAGIWTIHFGLDNDMWASEGRMRDLIGELELDVVGLLESDTQRIIMGNRDLTQKLAEELGMYADFGPGPNKHTWGCALLSKFPILNSTHHLLPSPVGELAPAIHATLNVYGELVDVVVFHSGQEEDVEDRRLQSLGVADIMGSTDRPMVLLSYLVTKPLKGNYHTYVSETSGMHDIDSSDSDRWCEYILYKNLRRTGYARVSRSTITDTELQVGKFQLLDEGEKVNYSEKRIRESKVPKGLQFPRQFRKNGVRGHRYHVFDEPRYYDS
ncbi:hypothetical protein LJB42_000329 [Komagataella kurtzmanii]|nr:hypothetical protein LJB42_000329 [Komagataella kurtzmanii]